MRRWPDETSPGGGETQPHRKVYWFLISDSTKLRKLAKAKYGGGGRLLTADDLPVHHIRTETDSPQLLLNVVGSEMWLFGLAHIHILSQSSTLGRLGAMASPHPPKYYHITGFNHRECWVDRQNPEDTLEALADVSVGI
ncbi:hypothetical protein HYH03_014475 [Edaphochlamys debaryana]|uniref:Uncharacterized protein n=1 Tax=Edaphochlamys debaryana TaxID=47281 RepID=A0A836BRX4_9CHLO|nr:hypothetical protein HYH03_014475 [Edaphochlamys debaryana]|eukprot:KAG2486881.1 hypothetical protein HYH03_014475 [Edaphochlamys debaryana]